MPRRGRVDAARRAAVHADPCRIRRIGRLGSIGRIASPRRSHPTLHFVEPQAWR
jgi:hypothetical protein